MPAQWCHLKADDDWMRHLSVGTPPASSYRVDRLCLYLSKPVLYWEFHPASVWHALEWRRPLPPREAFPPTGPAFISLFENAVEQCVGRAERVAVALSGGLDSAAVLHHASRISTRRRLKLSALIIAADDDAGRSNVPIATMLAKLLAPDADIHVVEDGPTGPVCLWDPVGPRLDASVFGRVAANDLAQRLGAEVILTGLGADELLGAPKYLLPALLRRPAEAVRYVRDLRGVTPASAAALELTAVLSRLASRSAAAKLYWSLNNPEVCATEPSPVLSSVYGEVAEAWTRQWLENSIGSESADWSQRDAYDAVYPYDALASSGPVPETSPYLEPGFFGAAMAIPTHKRYSSRYASGYHRRKCLVLSLLPDGLVPVLPATKQLFSADIRRGRARVREVIGSPTRCLELGLIRDGVHMTGRESAMVTAIEGWIRSAEAQGVTAS